MRLRNSSRSNWVTTNTSCAVVPRLAMILYPPQTGVETRSFRPEHRPRTREITPGVMYALNLNDKHIPQTPRMVASFSIKIN